MRVEINLVLFMKNKSYKKIDGFLSVADSRGDNEELMAAMCEFIDDVTEDYMDAFTSGLAQIVTGRNNVHYVSFKNPNIGTIGISLQKIVFKAQPVQLK